MARLTLTLATLVALVATASASIHSSKDQPVFDRQAWRAVDTAVPAELHGRPAPREPDLDFVVTPRTEILLDDKPCRYEAIPAGAVVVGIRVAADRKTAITIRFRSHK
jgi:hypothetical protein